MSKCAQCGVIIGNFKITANIPNKGKKYFCSFKCSNKYYFTNECKTEEAHKIDDKK